MKKSLIAILTATIILLSTLVPLLYVQPAQAASDPTSWYMTVPGVLNTDTYSLYPYAAKSLSIGISQFGEMIDPYTDVGLQYGSADPFVNEQFIPQFEWNQGWLINLTYSYTGEYRNVWAFALYSDSYNDSSIGGNWVHAPSPDSTSVVGGRKYGGIRWNNGNPIQIGYATTAPLTVLYNGPREFIAIAKNTIGEDANTPLVGVYLTFVFDKVKKYVTVYKDVKLLDTRKFLGNMQVEFSNRGEWDLGLTTAPPSYADFFDNQPTSYEAGYQPFYNNGTGTDHLATYNVAQILSTNPTSYVGFAAYWPSPISESMLATALTTRTLVLSSLSTFTADFFGNGTNKAFQVGTGSNPPAIPYPRGQGIWSSDPMVFVGGEIVPEDPTALNGWTWNNDTQTVIFNTAPGNNVSIWVIYKHHVYNPELVGEPAVPYIFAEWDFDLNNRNLTASTNMFRAVTVYGVTDRHDGSDLGYPAFGIQSDLIDREVMYQLNEVFNPFDLFQAVEKKTDRWVEFSTVPIGSTTFTTSNVPTLVVPTSEWDQYDQFSERVIDLNTSISLSRLFGDYTFTANADGTGTFGGLIPTHHYKFLYSTYTQYASNSTMDVLALNQTVANDTINASPTYTFYPSIDQTWTDPTGVSQVLTSDEFQFTFTNKSDTSFLNNNYTWTYNSPWQEWEAQPFKVFKENTATLEAGTDTIPPQNVSIGVGTATLQFQLQQMEFDWSITGPRGPLFTNLQDVHFTSFNPDFRLQIVVSYNSTTTNYTVTATVQFASDSEEQPIYAYMLPGRYEWVTVGTDANTIDVAGSIDVAAAFKDKQVEIGNAAMDMNGSTYQTQIPYLLSQTTSGKTPDFQNYWITPDPTSPGQRLSFSDDWCTRYPVSSSNIISVGGPLANEATEYFNSFTTAFYGEPWFTPYAPWQGAIVALSCWSKNVYTNSGGQNGTGYATIGTYLDLNGTVGFVIYGLDARDTYYASKFFYNDIIQELQNFPDGVTSIILKISYTDPKHPTFTIPEVLGTISETQVIGSLNIYLTSQLKGGIHPDP